MFRKMMPNLTFFGLLVLLGKHYNCDEWAGEESKPCWYVRPSTNFNYYQFNHKPHTLLDAQLDTLAGLSDKAHFKDTLLKPILRVREVGTESHAQVREHIVSTLKNLGWSVEEDTFQDDTPFGQKSFTNIIATHNPAKKRRLVLACHYDSKIFKQFEFIGATDSAVPCAMLLDLATRMKDYLLENPSFVSPQLIFFDGEEAFVQWTKTDSIYGARHLAKKLEAQQIEVEQGFNVPELKTIDAFVLLDLIGAPNPTFRHFHQETSKLWHLLQDLEKRMAGQGLLYPQAQFSSKRNKYFVAAGAGSGIEDDHIPFLHKKVPILHLICYPFPSVWHTRNDNEAALDYTTIDNLNKIMRAFVAEYLWLGRAVPES